MPPTFDTAPCMHVLTMAFNTARDRSALQQLLKGRSAAQLGLGDEGFVSYYMASPPSVFPRVTPAGVPHSLPISALRRVPLRNLPKKDFLDGKRGVEGNRRQYELKLGDELTKLGDGATIEALDGIKLLCLSKVRDADCTLSAP